MKVTIVDWVTNSDTETKVIRSCWEGVTLAQRRLKAISKSIELIKVYRSPLKRETLEIKVVFKIELQFKEFRGLLPVEISSSELLFELDYVRHSYNLPEAIAEQIVNEVTNHLSKYADVLSRFSKFLTEMTNWIKEDNQQPIQSVI